MFELLVETLHEKSGNALAAREENQEARVEVHILVPAQTSVCPHDVIAIQKR